MGCVVKKPHEPVAGLIACGFLKNSAAVSITPTFSATAEAIHWLVQGDSVILRQTLRRLVDREGGALRDR
jgi:hypothetical protein